MRVYLEIELNTTEKLFTYTCTVVMVLLTTRPKPIYIVYAL